MTLQEAIESALATAVSGSDVDSNVLRKQALEAEVLIDQALHQLATDVAGKPELRARLETSFSVTLTDGIGTLPAGILIEYLREGSVRDGDAGANNGAGNILSKVNHYDDLVRYLNAGFGYYCIVKNQIHTRQIGSGSLSTTASPLTIWAPFVPSKANLNTDVPDEILDDLVQILAVMLRGIISRQMEAAAPTP